MQHIPQEFWKAACEKVPHALACVGVDDHFVWVNDSWTRLLGYSASEITQKRWQDITISEDIGGDEAEAHKVREGTKTDYFLEKSYRRKDGEILPIALYVHRFPITVKEPLLCFIVTAKSRQKPAELEAMQRDITLLTATVATLMEKDWLSGTAAPWLLKYWPIIAGVGAVIGTVLSWVLR